MSRVDLVVNGEIRESVAVAPGEQAGHWSVQLDRSAWLALLVRGHYADKPEIIAAHSSPVMVDVEGSPLLAAADAVTILEQIEGALAYLDTVGTRAEDVAYKRMRLVLTPPTAPCTTACTSTASFTGTRPRLKRRGFTHKTSTVGGKLFSHAGNSSNKITHPLTP